MEYKDIFKMSGRSFALSAIYLTTRAIIYPNGDIPLNEEWRILNEGISFFNNWVPYTMSLSGLITLDTGVSALLSKKKESKSLSDRV